ncbi:hypothetical protein, partial [Phyllobacterium calauticae]|uniref:hypothetical protein n=1 Tax=Phyllobacterium calauticae TaxID=2817027 RepID=UPI001CC0118B
YSLSPGRAAISRSPPCPSMSLGICQDDILTLHNKRHFNLAATLFVAGYILFSTATGTKPSLFSGGCNAQQFPSVEHE